MAKSELGKPIGKVTHFFDKVGVAVVEVSGKLKNGDKIRIKGSTTDFEQAVGSMQVENKPIKEAKKGQAIGLKVSERVRPNDMVYLIK
jgi:translation elongation factor EF-1alpha